MSFLEFGKHTAVSVAALLSHTLGDRSRGAAGILVYHRVAPHPPGVPAPALNVTPQRFAKQILGLRDHGYRFLALDELLSLYRRRQAYPPRSVVLTFDDIYENVYRYAWPLLRDQQIPATMFLATAYLDSDQPFPFDPWGVRYQGLLDPVFYRPVRSAQCDEMLCSGLIQLGAHTHTHDDFCGRARDFGADLARSVEILRERFGVTDVPFAFPYGRYGSGHAGGELAVVAQEVGVTCALTTECTLVQTTEDPATWGRFNVYDWDSAGTLSARLRGWYGAVPGWRVAMDVVQARRKAKALAPVVSPAHGLKTAAEAGNSDVGEASPAYTAAAAPASICDESPKFGLPHGVWALVDQATVSGIRFATTVALGRFVGKEALGRYSLGFGFVMVAMAVQEALISLPYNIFLHRLQADQRRQYAGATLGLVMLIALAVTGLLGVVATALSMSDLLPGLSRVVWAIMATMPFCALFEFARRHAFARLQVMAATLLDVAAAVLQAIGLLVLVETGWLSSYAAYLVAGAGYGLIGGLWLLLSYREFSLQLRQIGEVFQRHWRFGRWVLGSQLALALRGAVVPWLVALTIGADAAGGFAACITIVLLANPFLLAMNNVLAPSMSKALADRGAAPLARLLFKVTLVLTCAMFVLAALLVFAGADLLELLYGEHYADEGATILILAIAMVVETFGLPAINSLWALERAELNFFASVAGLVVTAVVAVALVGSGGVVGAAVGLPAGRLVSSAIQIGAFLRAAREHEVLQGATT